MTEPGFPAPRHPALPAAWPAVSLLLLALLAGAAQARDSCAFLRDPAYYARAPVAPAAAGEVAVGTLNLFRLFDDEQDGRERELRTPAQLAAKVARQARYVARDMGAPSILAVQELEDDTAAAALQRALARETGRRWSHVLGEREPGEDTRTAVYTDERVVVESIATLFDRPAHAKGPRHDRLPLVADVRVAGVQLTLVVVHLRSMRGMDGRDAAEAARVREKRRVQAGELAAWVRTESARGRALLVLGDFNSPPGDAQDPRAEPLRLLVAPGVLADPGVRFLAPGQRWTYRYRCTLQQLDHVLVTPALLPRVTGYAIARGDTCLRAKDRCDAATSVSDHEGVVLRLR